MNKSIKILSALLIITVLVISLGTTVFATANSATILDDIENKTKSTTVSGDLTGMASKIIGIIRYASIIAAAILTAVFGFKFILGSAEEKSEYKKSFIPLIVGLIVVFGSTWIAKLILTVTQ